LRRKILVDAVVLVMEAANSTTTTREPWNKGKLVGQKTPFKLKEIWAIRVRLNRGVISRRQGSLTGQNQPVTVLKSLPPKRSLAPGED
jgi:hypothetical protein